MADVWEISRYVESHPENHGQRWRLAKKLYLAWEYRLALEHLQILKNEWDEKENVLRYLAATYYRLKRFNDSTGELEAALEIWPDSIGLREQLARTLDMGDRKEDGLEVWKEILERVPDHPFASRAVDIGERLKSGPPRGPVPAPQHYSPPEEAPAEGHAGKQFETTFETPPPSTPDLVCPFCGTRNSSGFGHCWRCHGVLSEASLSRLIVPVGSERKKRAQTSLFPIACGAVLVVLIVLDVYLTLPRFAAPERGESDIFVATTFREFVSERLAGTRVGLGLILVFCWPLLLNAGAYLTATQNVSRARLNFAGATLALFAYAMTWLPGLWVFIGLGCAAIAALLACMYFLGMTLRTALLAWMVQLIGVVSVSATAVAAIHGTGFVSELPLMVRYDSGPPNVPTLSYTGITPVEVKLKWESTGSAWLDRESASVGFDVRAGEHEKTLFVELRDDYERTKAFEKLKGQDVHITFEPIVLGAVYELLVTGREEGVVVTVEVWSLFNLTEIDEDESFE